MLREVARSRAQSAGPHGELKAQLVEAHARIAELERLADTDPLTGLANRRPFGRGVTRAVRHFERHGTPAALLFIDVDGLKAVNDAFGHAGGDAALMHIARTLQREVRSSDVVARIGGDEFGVVLDHATETAACAKAAALVLAVNGAPLAFGDAQVRVQLSIGVAAARADDDLESMLRRADDDMYAMKRAQRSDK